ncbi:probable galacturonosyltransferase 15 isoform X3 [Salvia hispanica]|uniref:probable galacturonosyltransferase 15 isoform X3 n=1 Tax=Salvia hispanica TaxID=49212 RepID=UPI0020095BD8|nr:probable galacturonosyltransferase 15 isoform X3 [Salvia hispanica]
MKVYVSAIGIKRLAASAVAGRGGVWRGMKWKNSLPAAGKRRLSHRTIRLFAGLLLPFLLVRTALLVFESAALCSSPIDAGCLTWRFFGGSDGALLREELTRALLEASGSENGGGITTVEGSNSDPVSFKDLVKDMTINRQDIKAFAFKTKAMIAKMEHIVKTAQWHESMYWHLAARGVPKSLHCLSLEMAEEYAVNAAARSRIPLPQYIHRLTDTSFHHVVLLTDNILAASVVISSTLNTSRNPEKLVFHVVTDKKTYTSMHAWFSVNSIGSAVVEVKGLHQYDWPHEVNVAVKEMLEIHHQIWNHNYRSLKTEDLEYGSENYHKLGVLSPSSVSLLNHLRVYLPELFPDLNKVVFLDDDVVVQHDLSPLWDLDLNQKVVAAVVDSNCGTDCCPGRKYKDYFNFTNPIISSILDENRCGWLCGVNVFDLQRWRKSNITAVYHQWLKLSLNSGFELWHPGALPPVLLAFENHVHAIDHSWHLSGLGYRYPLVDKQILETAGVVHFSGPAKPWLEIGSPEVRHLWTRHINSSNHHIRKCGIAS